MTTLLPGRLLISHITLRGPELAQVYGLIAGVGELGHADLADALGTPISEDGLGLEQAPLREALSFLTAARLIERRGTGRRAAYRVTTTQIDADFALLLLLSIQSHPDERQRAIALVHRELVGTDTLAISPAALRERMERSPYGSLFTWTGEKIQLWCHLAAFLGLIRRPQREPELLIIPQPNLVDAVLRWAATRVGSDSLATLVREIDTQCFACLTARGRIHRGLAQTLLSLERTGRLRLVHRADSARSLLLGERRVSDVAFAGDVL